MDANQASRLEELRRSGWVLTERTVYTLRRHDRDGGEPQSFFGEDLDAVTRRAAEAQRPKPRSKQEQMQSGGVEIDEAMARRLASSNVATGLVSTESYRTTNR